MNTEGALQRKEWIKVAAYSAAVLSFVNTLVTSSASKTSSDLMSASLALNTLAEISQINREYLNVDKWRFLALEIIQSIECNRT